MDISRPIVRMRYELEFDGIQFQLTQLTVPILQALYEKLGARFPPIGSGDLHAISGQSLSQFGVRVQFKSGCTTDITVNNMVCQSDYLLNWDDVAAFEDAIRLSADVVKELPDLRIQRSKIELDTWLVLTDAERADTLLRKYTEAGWQPSFEDLGCEHQFLPSGRLTHQSEGWGVSYRIEASAIREAHLYINPDSPDG